MEYQPHNKKLKAAKSYKIRKTRLPKIGLMLAQDLAYDWVYKHFDLLGLGEPGRRDFRLKTVDDRVWVVVPSNSPLITD